jgi:hypothetical protein
MRSEIDGSYQFENVVGHTFRFFFFVINVRDTATTIIGSTFDIDLPFGPTGTESNTYINSET